MNTSRLIIITGVLSMLMSCGEKVFTGDVDCSQCYTPKPDTMDLIIDFTINSDYKKVPFVLYRGDFEDNQVDWIDTATVSPWHLSVKVGQKYSLKAKYKKGDKTLFAVDETTVKALQVTDACDEHCYVIKNQHMNLKIKDDFLDF
jgi:hypothetical protein